MFHAPAEFSQKILQLLPGAVIDLADQFQFDVFVFPEQFRKHLQHQVESSGGIESPWIDDSQFSAFLCVLQRMELPPVHEIRNAVHFDFRIVAHGTVPVDGIRVHGYQFMTVGDGLPDGLLMKYHRFLRQAVMRIVPENSMGNPQGIRGGIKRSDQKRRIDHQGAGILILPPVDCFAEGVEKQFRMQRRYRQFPIFAMMG